MIVGIHGDSTVNRIRGMNLPIMNLHERVLSVLGCRYADDVLIDAPYEISNEMIASLNISEVIGTRVYDSCSSSCDDIQDHHHARYRPAEESGLLHYLDVESNFDIVRIVDRIQKNQAAYQAKFDRKMEAERRFYQQKHHHPAVDQCERSSGKDEEECM